MIRALGFLLLALAAAAFAEPPADVIRLFSDMAEALANDDARGFLGKFDDGMHNYALLRDEVEALLGANEVGSTIEIVSDEGDEQKRVVQLDWLLFINAKNVIDGQKETRRQIIKCQVERRGRQWKITSIEPVEFFKY
jgi:hypothetical protein